MARRRKGRLRLVLRAVIKPGKEKKVKNFYPTVYADELEKAPGEEGVVKLFSAAGEILGVGYYDPASRAAIRLYRFDEGPLDEGFFEKRFLLAQKRRRGLGEYHRLVHAEADGLPGLVVDRFKDVLLVQVRTKGAYRLLPRWQEPLKEVSGAKSALLVPTEHAQKEGLSLSRAALWGDAPKTLVVEEDGLVFEIPLELAQTKGYYLDQRENRRLFEAEVAPGEEVLDVYSHVGGFALRAARKGARVLAVDKDLAALSVLDRAARRLGLSVDIRSGDALEVLKALVAEGRRFHRVVLDPPALAKSPRDLPRAKALFTELIASAFRLLRPEGRLWVSSCSYYIKEADLLEAARRAGADTKTRFRVVRVTHQPKDHPWVAQVPETLYLKTLVLEPFPL